MTKPKPSTNVAVVLCSYEGERFIGAQLDSIAQQSHPVSLYVYDDASSDGTAALTRAHAAGATVVVRDSNEGFLRNFELGLRAALEAGHTHMALADQDDLWDEDRIERGLDALKAIEHKHGADFPALVHSDLRRIDVSGNLIDPSYFKARGYSVDNRRDLPRVLGQNGVMGNTVIMNRALASLALPFPEGLHMHDWWIAVLAELFGERHCLVSPTVSYRVHAGNLSNSIQSARAHGILARLVAFPARLVSRDFRLPYKEDSRVEVVRQLLNGLPGLPALTTEQYSELVRFLAYLELVGSRWMLYQSSASAGFFPGSVWRRMRVAFALLFSRRYDDES